MTEKPTRMNLGSDPLDPHGDGTIRQGDPLYDLLMSGDVAHAERVSDAGDWDVFGAPDSEQQAFAVDMALRMEQDDPPKPLPWWWKVLARIGGRR